MADLLHAFKANMPIALGSDHAGFSYKALIKQYLEESGFKVLDMGADSQKAVDYPDFAHPVAEVVAAGEASFGILICGSGNGVAMSANKHAEIRAAVCWEEELARLARAHNDANVLCMPARFINEKIAKRMVIVFQNTLFEGGRHESRVDKIACK